LRSSVLAPALVLGVLSAIALASLSGCAPAFQAVPEPQAARPAAAIDAEAPEGLETATFGLG